MFYLCFFIFVFCLVVFHRYTVSGPLDGVDGLPGMDGADSFTVR